MKRDQFYVKGPSNLDTTKSSAESTGNFEKNAQNLCRIEEDTFAFTARHHTRKETTKYVEMYKRSQHPE